MRHAGIRVITFDLDDSLWDIAPAIEYAEQELHTWFGRHVPAVARRFGERALRELREKVRARFPGLAHDLTELRRRTILAALDAVGADAAHVEPAFAAYYRARNAVQLHPDVEPALEALASRFVLGTLTNGNADLEQIGIGRFFRFQITARRIGAAKPDARIFAAACRAARVTPGEILHVGDDPALDVLGARSAGLQACWLNRRGLAWTLSEPAAELEVPDLHALRDYLFSAAASRKAVTSGG